MVEEDLRQGGVLSPLLLNLIMDDFIAEAKNEMSKLYVGLCHLQPVHKQQCAFADGLAVFANIEQNLQKNIEIWSRDLAKKKLKINAEQSIVMTFRK